MDNDSKSLLAALTVGRYLSAEEAELALNQMLDGQWTPAQMAAYATAIQMRGIQPAEFIGSARAMRRKAQPIDFKRRPVIDPVGTGGDGLGTINVSTIAGLIAASCGASIAKHGNRSFTGICGSADFVESLGISLALPIEKVAELLDRFGFCFLFAPAFHLGMRHIGPVRQELAFPTLFNQLGPLANPAHPELHLLGVNQADQLEVVTEILIELGCTHSIVVHGHSGMDELSLSGETVAIEQHHGQLKKLTISPEQFGLTPCSTEQLRLADRKAVIAMGKAVLNNSVDEDNPQRQFALINAAAIVYLAQLASSLEEGFKVAEQVLSSGKTAQLVADLAAYSRLNA